LFGFTHFDQDEQEEDEPSPDRSEKKSIQKDSSSPAERDDNSPEVTS